MIIFTPNTLLKSSEVNANFAGVADGTEINDSAILPRHLNTDATASDWVWQNWTPTYTALTIGSGTVVARYCLIGKTCHFLFQFVYGSGSAVGTDPRFSLPVQALYTQVPFSAFILRSGVTRYDVNAFNSFTTIVSLFVWNATTTYTSQSAITSTVPMTWTTNDQLYVSGTYEVA